MGVVEAICVSVENGTVKLPVPSVQLRERWGIEGEMPLAHALERNDETGALTRYEQLWRGEFSNRVYVPGYAFQPFMNNAWFVDAFMRYTAKK